MKITSFPRRVFTMLDEVMKDTRSKKNSVDERGHEEQEEQRCLKRKSATNVVARSKCVLGFGMTPPTQRPVPYKKYGKKDIRQLFFQNIDFDKIVDDREVTQVRIEFCTQRS